MRRRGSKPGCWIKAERAADFPAHTLMRIGTLALRRQSALFTMMIRKFAQSLIGEWASFVWFKEG
jgi:hypothetical protein